MKIRTARWLGVAAALLLATACASSGGGAGDGAPRRDTNVLLPAEIAQAPVANLYEAVERFRPRWLQVRSPRSLNMQTSVAVFLNRSYLGTPDALRQIGLAGLVRMQYLDAARAQALYQVPDGVAIEGAIVVEVGGDD